MATTVPGFDAEGFRAGIRLAMRIGLPPEASDQPKFFFRAQVTNLDPADAEDVPFDPDARPVVTTPPPVTVTCAVDYVDAEGKVENFGIIVPSKVKLTLLDEEYQLVRGFSYVVIAGDRFFYRKTEPPVGMDSVAVWTVHCQAEDDS